MKTLQKNGHEETISAICKLDETTIASASHDSTIKIWDWVEGKCLVTLQGHELPVLCLSKLDGYRLASGSDDCNIKVWNYKENPKLEERTLYGHSSWV